MSGTSNAFTNPSKGRIDQQRKILEELEKQKKQLNQQSSTGFMSNNSMNNSNNVPSATPATTTTNSPGRVPNMTLMPCPFTGPKMFCACPNFLSQPKNLTASSAS